MPALPSLRDAGGLAGYPGSGGVVYTEPVSSSDIRFDDTSADHTERVQRPNQEGAFYGVARRERPVEGFGASNPDPGGRALHSAKQRWSPE